MTESDPVYPGDRVEVIIYGTVTSGGGVMLDDGSIWRFLPDVATIRRIPDPDSDRKPGQPGPV